MISDCHRGLLNGAKDHLEGYPALIHMWCSRHFAANIWKKQQSKEVIARLKALCKVKEEKKIFAFDEGGSQYGIMTMNISEVFNFVLKGIHSLSVSAIVDYTFHKCNEYFMSR
jgi:hypothetical protein